MGYVKIPEATNRTTDFTSSGTWTCPAGVYSAEFLVVGAGGGGGGVGTNTGTEYSCGGGGGGGAVKKITLPVVPATSYTITVGAKGTGSAGAAGGNGGYSEILNGASVLIRAYGGGGGAGIAAGGNELAPTASATVGGGGGKSIVHSAQCFGGGGGGAFAAFADKSASNLTGNAATTIHTFGLDGRHGNGTTISAIPNFSFGGIGIENYGGGGGGGASITSAVSDPLSKGSYGSGAGAVRSTTGITAGSAAIANTGAGGGGASSHTNATTAAGGNGADGIVRITYFA